MAKSHSGKSKSYSTKLAVRESRTEDREFLVKAKEWVREHAHILVGPEMAGCAEVPTYPRGKITQIKKILKAGATPSIEEFKMRPIARPSGALDHQKYRNATVPVA